MTSNGKKYQKDYAFSGKIIKKISEKMYVVALNPFYGSATGKFEYATFIFPNGRKFSKFSIVYVVGSPEVSEYDGKKQLKVFVHGFWEMELTAEAEPFTGSEPVDDEDLPF